jgi:hypothetical protein
MGHDLYDIKMFAEQADATAGDLASGRYEHDDDVRRLFWFVGKIKEGIDRLYFGDEPEPA